MNKPKWMLAGMALAVAAAFTTSGCQTYGEAAGLGAAIGAGTGAVIGHQSGRALEGAAIGAVVGSMAGLIAHDIKSKRERTREETAAAYNYEPTQGEMLTYERTDALPQSVRPGEQVETSIQYALLGAGGGVQVNESRTLMRGDRLEAELSSQNFTRTDGTWVSSQSFRLPRDAERGEYTVVTRVSTAQSGPVSGRARFYVE